MSSRTMGIKKPLPIVLNIGVDPDYRRRRREILEEAGFKVLDAASVEQALQLARGKQVHLAIFGHRISAGDRVQLSETLKRALPGIRLVVMYDQSIAKTEAADAVLQINVPAADLIHTVEYLLSGGYRDSPQQART